MTHRSQWRSSVRVLFILLIGLALPAKAVDFQIAPPNPDVFCGDFQGFGAEWDPFFWNDNNQNRGCIQEHWDLITQRLRDLKVGIVRMMMQLYWAQSAPDLSQWQWDTPQMKSVFQYLDFCQQEMIDVVLTDWGWTVGAYYDSNPTDQRFAQGVAEYLKEFIERRGYTQIKYLVIGNEPDNELKATYGMDVYVAIYRNVDQALSAAGIRDRVKLMGPDMGGDWQFMKDGIDQLKDVVNTYDFHRYASFDETGNFNLPGTWETLWSHLDLWRSEVLSRDPQGAQKFLLLTEMGNAGGSTNSHPLIDTYDYAIHMADYGTTLLTTRIQAGIAWCMHDMYYFDGDQFMQWGMWKYADNDWQLRPWSQSFGLLIKHAPKGSRRCPVNSTPPATPELSQFRAAAVERPDGGFSLFLVNRTVQVEPFHLQLPRPVTRPFLRFEVDSNTFATFSSTLVLPPVGTLQPSGDMVDLMVPAQGFVVLVEDVQGIAEEIGQEEPALPGEDGGTAPDDLQDGSPRDDFFALQDRGNEDRDSAVTQGEEAAFADEGLNSVDSFPGKVRGEGCAGCWGTHSPTGMPDVALGGMPLLLAGLWLFRRISV